MGTNVPDTHESKKGSNMRVWTSQNVLKMWLYLLLKTEIRGWAAKDFLLMLSLPSTKASWALYFHSKLCTHQHYFSLPSFGHFCFFSRFPKHKTGCCWLVSAGPDLLSQCYVCYSFPLFTLSFANAISQLEICLTGIHICQVYILSGSPVLINVCVRGIKLR